MSTAILNLTNARISAPVAFFSTFSKLFRGARRFEQLFAMSDRQLSSRGLSRDALVRSYISGLGHS